MVTSFQINPNDRFGSLVALAPTEQRSSGKVVWRCLCDCGSEAFVQSAHLRSGHTQSCGNHPNRARLTHGHADNPLYDVWHGIKARCENNPRYRDRGIRLCDRWHDVSTFIADMQDGYRPGLTVDRKDNDGIYEPSNCRWATRAEQARNRCTNRFITFKDQTMTVQDWSTKTGIHQRTITTRLDKLGWTVDRALTEPSMFPGSGPKRKR